MLLHLGRFPGLLLVHCASCEAHLSCLVCRLPQPAAADNGCNITGASCCGPRRSLVGSSAPPDDGESQFHRTGSACPAHFRPAGSTSQVSFGSVRFWVASAVSTRPADVCPRSPVVASCCWSNWVHRQRPESSNLCLGSRHAAFSAPGSTPHSWKPLGQRSSRCEIVLSGSLLVLRKQRFAAHVVVARLTHVPPTPAASRQTGREIPQKHSSLATLRFQRPTLPLQCRLSATSRRQPPTHHDFTPKR